jgi:ZIP family zinc transporter
LSNLQIGTLFAVLSFAVFPAVSVVLGGFIAFIRTPTAAVRSAVQHFAAGVIFCVLATELLPDLIHRRMPIWTIVGFSLGVATMLAVKHFAEGSPAEGATVTGAFADKTSSSLVFAMGLDIALDGLLIGLGFAAGQKQGLLLTIAMVMEVFFLGLACATSLTANAASRSRIVWTLVIFGGLLLAGASAGAIALTQLAPAALDALLAFGVAALLYLVTEELLVEAHEVPETPFQTAMFFVGFIVLFTVDMLI